MQFAYRMGQGLANQSPIRPFSILYPNNLDPVLTEVLVSPVPATPSPPQHTEPRLLVRVCGEGAGNRVQAKWFSSHSGVGQESPGLWGRIVSICVGEVRRL